MNKLLVTIALLLSSSVYAATPTPDELCDGWANKAKQYMEVRQNGTPIHEAMKMTIGNYSRGLMLRAFDEPVAARAEEKLSIIKTFSGIIKTECLENHKDMN
ncbi:hypothetical protein LCGC14_1526440 [marine sediment metagenome]|uniref:Uncharacterized protein n=1 Tax=marine sediment metagenome TaxID=412755 RepID=A0A0F9IX09_9ZZZZ